MIDNPRSNFDRVVMLNLLKNIMQDASVYCWMQIRNDYSMLTLGVEMNRYYSLSINVCQLTSPLLIIYIAVKPCMLYFELLFCSRPRALAARVYYVKLLPTRNKDYL